MASMDVGHGRECITPPLGIRMMGYASRKEGATDIHDDLYVNAVALRADGVTAAIVAYDVCLFDLELADEIRDAVAGANGLSPEEVLVNTSHTHAGPALGARYAEAENAEYRQSIIAGGVAAATQAFGDLRPARLSVGHAPVHIGCNRRERRPDGEIILGHNPGGPTRHEMTVWRFGRGAGADVVLFSTPMHGTVLGGGNLRISAEWMGAAVKLVEQDAPDVRAVFLQGCGADQDPYYTTTEGKRGTFDEVEVAGRKAADAVLAAMAAARELAGSPVGLSAGTVSLPGKEDASDTRDLRIHGLRLGDAVLLTLSCEAFVEYDLFGRSVSGAQETLVLGYTNGNIGYLCTADVFPEGGYEPRTTRVAPESEQMVKDAMQSTLADLTG